jgi:creatinine amidohydrolase
MYHLANIPFPEFDRVARSGRALLILPVGVVEEHGAHLPLGLDSFAAEIYAAAAAPHLEQAGFEILVAPTIAYGVARAAIDFPGTLSLEPETLRSLLVDVGRSLARHGLKRQVILNGHRDLVHMRALDDARDTLIAEKAAEVLCVGFTSDPNVTAACYREGVPELSQSARPDREGHGGEWETSLALFSFPELVNREIIKNLDPNFDYDVEAFRGETKDYRTLSGGRGYFGSPQSANAVTGEKIIAIRGRNIARVILNAWGVASTELLSPRTQDTEHGSNCKQR